MFFTDEHVPRIFVATLKSYEYRVIKAIDKFGEETKDKEILRYCGENELIFITNDKKDFSGEISEKIDHNGIIIYTNPNYLKNNPEDVVETIERILT